VAKHHHNDPGPAIPSRQFAPVKIALFRDNRPGFGGSGRSWSDSHWLPDHNPFADNPGLIFLKFAQHFSRYFKSVPGYRELYR
jgi:hypothetical protein